MIICYSIVHVSRYFKYFFQIVQIEICESESNQRHLACFLLRVCLQLWEQEVEQLRRKHRETSLISHLEGLLREKSSEATEKGEDQIG